MCTHCGTQESVNHRLFNCSKGNLDYLRGVFDNECVTFFPDWRSKSPNDKLIIILNANPVSLKEQKRVDMIKATCTFIKKAYEID